MIWTVSMWVLLVLGVVVGVRAWVWDRAGFRGRPKRRCRRCWYDLSAALEGDEGFRCPECGKVHRTIRSMRKTRRSKRLVLVATVLVIASGAVEDFAAKKYRGWIVCVPDWVLVVWIPFSDPTPGSSFDQTMWGMSATPSLEYRVTREIKQPVHKSPHRWIADRLVFLLARFEPDAVLTDSTTDRGSLYASRMNSAIWGDFAFGFEERWARSVVYAEFQTRERIAPGSPIYGRLQTRRLIQGEYRINFGGNVAWFDARTRSDSVWSGGGGAGGGPGVRDANEYIELQQWDNLARRYRVLYGESARGELEVHHTQLDLGATGEQHMAVSFTVHDQGEQSKGEWNEVGHGGAAYSFVADAAAAPTLIHGRAFLDELESKSYATLGVRHNQENNEWELVAMIHQSEFEWEDEITFGGAVSIELEQPDGSGKLYRRLLRGPSKWWRWVPGTRPAPDMDENTSEYWEHWREGELIPSGIGDPYFDGYGIPFHDDGSFARFQNDDGRLVLRVRADSVRESQIVYADLEADRVIAGDIVFPIRSWTVEELNAYRISGLVPKHAMPN